MVKLSRFFIRGFFCGIFAAIILYLSPLYAADVKITGKKGQWTLSVNGKPFYIKGVGCGLAKGKEGEDYLKLAKELGANCLRTWGTDQGNKTYLDQAWKYGLMVDAGIWVEWVDPERGISYIDKSPFLEKKREDILAYVREFKSHPAVLLWNVGNEAIFFTKSEEEKIALCKFLEDVIREIHSIDPQHPVVYTSAGYLDLPYLKKYVPSLDIVGMNGYASIRLFHSRWDYLGFDKPYLITEYGPFLPSDRTKDKNGIPEELGDYQKAMLYKDYTEQIFSFRGFNLGGFVFHLGETTQESMTWWNINQGRLERQSYWVIYEAYTGKKASKYAPKIKKMFLSKSENLAPGEIITAEVVLNETNPVQYSFEYRLSTAEYNVLQYYVNNLVDIQAIGSGRKVQIKVPEQCGIYRLYCFVKDKDGNCSSVNKSISVTAQ